MAGRRRRAAPAVRRRVDQPASFGSGLGVARGDRARGGGRVVHRRAGRAADEAVHHLQQRRAGPRSSAPRTKPSRRPAEARRGPPRVGRARGARSGVPASGKTAHGGERRPRQASRTSRSRRRSATVRASSCSARERRSRICTIDCRPRRRPRGAERRRSCPPKADRCCSMPRSWCFAPDRRSSVRWSGASRKRSPRTATNW